MPKDDQLCNSHLVQAVRKYPCLYNCNLKEYSNKKLTNEAWERVAEEMNDSVIICKEKWRNLRIVFSRHLQKSLNGNSSGKAKYYLYEQMEFLKPFVRCRISQVFLPYAELTDESTETLENVHDPVVVNSEVGEMSNEIAEKQVEGHLMESNGHGQKSADERDKRDGQDKHLEDCFDYYTNSPKKKFKHSNDIDSNDSDLDKIDHRSNYKLQFLHSLLPDLEEMSPVQFRKFRKAVTSVIDEILDP